VGIRNSDRALNPFQAAIFPYSRKGFGLHMVKSLVEEIDEVVQRKSLLKHPFYQMWSKGELSEDHLKGYSMEYFQLVKQVPTLVSNTLKKSEFSFHGSIQENLEEEKEHVELWIRFCSSLGISKDALQHYKGLRQSVDAVGDLKSLTSLSFAEAVAALYAYELELPKISATKIDGLKKFYGLNSRDALIYFETHEQADVKHAAVWRKILSNVNDKSEQELALRAAVRSLEAQNKLLDSVMEEYVN
jgi:pyrroloquinoline-quinone synthase